MKEKKSNFIETAMHYHQIVMLLTGILVAFGIWALINIPKNEFPNFTIRQGVVVVVYPGATSAEVEEQVTKPMEKFLWRYKEIKKRKTYTQSRDGMAIIYVELNDDITDKDEFWSKFKHGVESYKQQLPTGVAAVLVNDDFGDTSALLIAMESDQKDYRQMNTYMDELEDRLRRIEALANVRKYGCQSEQIGIYLNQEKTAEYGLSSSMLAGNLLSQSITTVSGAVNNRMTKIPLHVKRSYDSEYDIAQQIIYTDPTGHLIRLKDIADIRREYPDKSDYITYNGKKCVLLSVEMNHGNNIVDFGKEVNNVISDYQKTLPNDVHIYKITDQSQVVGDSIINFLRELLIAVVAVMVVIMLLMPMRIAGVAASSIPITIFISIGIFMMVGIELNTVTLAALIVTLGMIVDNSIVIIDSYVEKLASGMSRWHAASTSAKEFLSSIFSATLAISITFFPFLLTMKGMFHDFLLSFPTSISIVLGVSLLVAIFIIPYLQYLFIKNGTKKKKNGNKTVLERVQNGYDKTIETCFRHPYLILGCGTAIIIGGILLFNKLPQRLMPVAERNQFAVEITLPEGTAVEKTATIADSLEHILRKDKRVKSITSFIGCSSPRFHTAYAPSIAGSNYAQFIVNTSDDKATVDLLNHYAPIYTDYFPEAMVRFKQMEYSDANIPIEIRLQGDNAAELRRMNDSIMRRLRQHPDLILVRSSLLDLTPGIAVNLNGDEATRLGISKTATSVGLASRFSDGVPISTLWEGDYPLSVVLKNDKCRQMNADELGNTYLPTMIPGNNIPLRQVANVKPEWTDGQITRRNGIQTVCVYADVRRNVNVNDATKRVIREMQEVKIPEGVTLSYGGAQESDNETLPNIISALVISVFIIFFILLFHFRNVKLTLLLISTMVIALPGAAIGLGITGMDVSMTSILGIVSLMGILSRNGIIMVDYAEDLRKKQGLSVYDAILNSAKRRMRPIFLTSAAASMGVIPMMIGGSSLWSPLGSVVFFGTFVSMILIITMLPIAYWKIFTHKQQTR
ncbi:MAG: efflux RND transporter permease subunit [Paludibacteraceae bacterium]|nr:efflux RND transporter permease subunit [Paludibacteraceae bacterium]